jgi:hypothetical protein
MTDKTKKSNKIKSSTKNTPTNNKLWIQAKKQADKIYDKPSAYKSGYIVKYYKDHGGKFKENNKNKEGLTRWFKEKWVNQHGDVGYKHKNDIYRPSKRISSKSPVTWKELTKKEIEIASKKKYTLGRVDRFKN